jgi:hypothetical protein
MTQSKGHRKVHCSCSFFIKGPMYFLDSSASAGHRKGRPRAPEEKGGAVRGWGCPWGTQIHTAYGFARLCVTQHIGLKISGLLGRRASRGSIALNGDGKLPGTVDRRLSF